jgi:hypothetical protein
MPTQTSYFQQEIIQEARQSNTLGDLYWYIEAEFPKRMIPAGIRRRQPAQWPRGCIPVIPAAPDPDASRAWAELLAELFNLDNRGRGIVFAPALTSVGLLDGLAWYEYGEPLPPIEVDHICGTCGQIHRGPVGKPPRCECYAW